jgi:hypothetical protein
MFISETHRVSGSVQHNSRGIRVTLLLWCFVMDMKHHGRLQPSGFTNAYFMRQQTFTEQAFLSKNSLVALKVDVVETG